MEADNRNYVGKKGWIGVDLDGCLAEYHGWKGPLDIGEPIPAMVEKVKRVLDEGKYDIKIFTARISEPDIFKRVKIVDAIRAWCLNVFGVSFTVTDVKDWAMVELWDDRCRQVVFNTGKFIGE
jgi:hypothetical protein